MFDQIGLNKPIWITVIRIMTDGYWCGTTNDGQLLPHISVSILVQQLQSSFANFITAKINHSFHKNTNSLQAVVGYSRAERRERYSASQRFFIVELRLSTASQRQLRIQGTERV